MYANCIKGERQRVGGLRRQPLQRPLNGGERCEKMAIGARIPTDQIQSTVPPGVSESDLATVEKAVAVDFRDLGGKPVEEGGHGRADEILPRRRTARMTACLQRDPPRPPILSDMDVDHRVCSPPHTGVAVSADRRRASVTARRSPAPVASGKDGLSPAMASLPKMRVISACTLTASSEGRPMRAESSS